METVLAVVIVGAIGFIGWYVLSALHNTNSAYSTATKTSTSKSPKFAVNAVATGSATLSGVITEGPTSPTTQAGTSNSAPVANHLVQALDAQGRVAASNKTSTQGNYLFHLKPGAYTLVLVPAIGPGSLQNNTVQVKAGANTFNLSVDTGIR